MKKLLLSIALATTLANSAVAQEQEAITKTDVLKKTARIGAAAAEMALGALFAKAFYVAFYEKAQIKNDYIDAFFTVLKKQSPKVTRDEVEGFLNKFTLASEFASLALFAHGAYGLYQELKPIAEHLYKKVKTQKPEQLQEQAA